MAEFEILEFDTDYHTVVDVLRKEFNTVEEAEKWCDKNDGSGYRYILRSKHYE